MDLIRLDYIHFILKEKVECRYSTWLSKLDSIYIYNLKSIAKAIK